MFDNSYLEGGFSSPLNLGVVCDYSNRIWWKFVQWEGPGLGRLCLSISSLVGTLNLGAFSVTLINFISAVSGSQKHCAGSTENSHILLPLPLCALHCPINNLHQWDSSVNHCWTRTNTSSPRVHSLCCDSLLVHMLWVWTRVKWCTISVSFHCPCWFHQRQSLSLYCLHNFASSRMLESYSV